MDSFSGPENPLMTYILLIPHSLNEKTESRNTLVLKDTAKISCDF